MTPSISDSPDNDRIIAEVFADRIKSTRSARYPTAEELADMPVERIKIR